MMSSYLQEFIRDWKETFFLISIYFEYCNRFWRGKSLYFYIVNKKKIVIDYKTRIDKFKSDMCNDRDEILVEDMVLFTNQVYFYNKIFLTSYKYTIFISNLAIYKL